MALIQSGLFFHNKTETKRSLIIHLESKSSIVKEKCQNITG
jgi:hypothetical protein